MNTQPTTAKQVTNLTQNDIAMFYSFGEQIISNTRKLIMKLWNNNDLQTEIKADDSPVTQVDLKAEAMVRDLIQKQFPSHGIIGEEYDSENSGSEFQWTIDPIDGTQNLVNRIPTFGTLLGLRFCNEPVLGFIDHPALNLCYQGAKGIGAFANGRKQTITDLATDLIPTNEIIATSSLPTFQRNNLGQNFFTLLDYHPNTRIYYDCYAHSLAISGSLAATVEFNLKIWDLTPAEILIPEAGGKFSYINPQGANHSKSFYHAVFGKPQVVSKLVNLF